MPGPFVLAAQGVLALQPMLTWVTVSMMSVSGLLAMLLEVVLFAGACYLIATKRRPGVIGAYMLLLPLPAVVMIGSTLSGMISSFAVFGTAPDVRVTSAEYFRFADSLMGLCVVLWITMPTYVLLALGLLAAIWRSPTEATKPPPIPA
jgi:hypothetical protein